MRQNINIDYYAEPPNFIKDRRGVVIIFTNSGMLFSNCKRKVITGYAWCTNATDKKSASPSSNRDAWSKGYKESGKSRGLRHYWNAIDENGARSIIRWDKLLRYKNKGELNFYSPEKESGGQS